ncbi:MAG: cell division protein SepF [Atopobiaceae bacterium]|jgi:cell division inhibitor SepF|nr:cell division protein SepF [Atopobiaceae bacterium]MCH4120441.1 cell division protein SepF [Atopobiaceae bacterium]MCI1318507.1 cell division protein SepF [Atopobiaceae bacterium]MCI1388279.1 cell division protein SepF [Atopobiaceae bacterium]MCI1431471.1 cell division protein SepF [Atopobiaceae bacterium]
MGFIDNIKDRMGFGSKDDYYDDGYDDGYDDYDDSYASDARPRHASSASSDSTSLLGTPSRPKAESINVYTRSGEFVDSNYEGVDYSAPSPQDRNLNVRDNSAWTDSRLDYSPSYEGTTPQVTGPTSPTTAPSTPSSTSPAMRSGASLPPYVLSPTAYDDVQMVVRRVRTNQPVVLDFRQTNIETAKRILDFSFGFACGVGGKVSELGDRAFVVLPSGIELMQSDMERLAREGVVRR